ncbi:rho GTPase-activating protein 20-like [Hippopotamus amphibius kiboko]|uniref:rho GTPase-activating protein 20-like n=1 Tax=Hippopotamus amphibius kiboko TaxID=575201 RepID=UPI00259A2202|nr:rho GTPase-activating protein 20-like [Hippopotamus amphibius kiboko]
MWTANCTDKVAEANIGARKAFVLGWPTVNFVATFSSVAMKFQSMVFFESACLAFSELLEFGSEKDYQLWASSGKKEASYPLIDAGQKTVKKSSAKNWAFWRSFRTRRDSQGPAPPPTKPKPLFGVSLEDVCDDDSLPTPIRDILYFINQKGPLTEGIFRKPGSIKSCRALQEKINSGDKVNLDEESVLVAASVFKDFLRNIQGSIFSASLYDKWLGVIDQGNEEEKIAAAQSLLGQLPRANVVLLQYLFGVLRNIEQNSSSNQMTAHNLSVCIAPSILCPPRSGSSALENDFRKKISFVQFLIENCLKIFGEDITSLFEESSMSCDSSDITDSREKAAVTTEQPLESKPVRETVIYKKAQLQDDAKTPPSMGPPSDVSTTF